MEHAEGLAAEDTPQDRAVADLGEGRVAEEALAISMYCALVASGFEDGIIVAVNHDGDSDSTGSLAGNLLGAMDGAQAISQKWLASLELRTVVAEVPNDLYTFPGWDFEKDRERIWSKYPGV